MNEITLKRAIKKPKRSKKANEMKTFFNCSKNVLRLGGANSKGSKINEPRSRPIKRNAESLLLWSTL